MVPFLHEHPKLIVDVPAIQHRIIRRSRINGKIYLSVFRINHSPQANNGVFPVKQFSRGWVRGDGKVDRVGAVIEHSHRFSPLNWRAQLQKNQVSWYSHLLFCVT